VVTLKEIVDSYMAKAYGVREFCERCLRTERWGGNVVLMVIDASFTSIGLNYFKTVVPKVMEFKKKFVETNRIKNLKDLAMFEINELRTIWKNMRSLRVSKEIASYLSSLNMDDRKSLRHWAKNTILNEWKSDPIGSIKGVGLVTYQYLRMMGGVDTVMPDKIVKRVINEILIKAGYRPIYDDLAFIKKAEEIAISCGYRPIELCWMTWLIQEEGNMIRMDKYAELLNNI